MKDEYSISEDLVRRCQKGEGGAFKELFRLHGGMIQKISMRMTRNAEWQRDIFQDVAEQVFGNIRAFRGECKFTTWLYRVTVNASMRFLQREGRYKNMLPAEEAGESMVVQGSEEESALVQVEKKELFGQVMAALMTLPRDNRDILSLFYFADRTIEEIADVTGKSCGAIKAVLWKGRRAMVKDLKKRGLFRQV